jgi:hypothetical protein
MMTTENSGGISDEEFNYKDQPDNDNGKTQAQIDREERARLLKTEVGAPDSESQVQAGQEVVDGNSRRDTEEVEKVRPDILVDKNADTQAKADQQQRDYAKAVQDKQNAKLNANSKPGEAPKDDK